MPGHCGVIPCPLGAHGPHPFTYLSSIVPPISEPPYFLHLAFLYIQLLVFFIYPQKTSTLALILQRMAPRLASTRGETSTPANRRGARGGISKNTQNRQPPNRYGQPADSAPRSSNGQEQIEPSSTSNEIEPSTPR